MSQSNRDNCLLGLKISDAPDVSNARCCYGVIINGFDPRQIAGPFPEPSLELPPYFLDASLRETVSLLGFLLASCE